MDSASSRALGIADIVANVLRHLQYHTFAGLSRMQKLVLALPLLARYAQVNKLWADETTDLVWAELDSLQPLANVKPERRQYYATKIKFLRIRLDPQSPPVTACLSGLHLPRLREVELIFSYDATPQHIPPVLPPGVRAVKIHCSNRCLSRATEYALRAVTTRCQKLERFTYHGPSRHLTSHVLLDFIKQVSSVLDLRIGFAWPVTQHCFTEDVVTYLADRSLIRTLFAPECRLCVPNELAQAVLTPFRSLEVLDVQADYDSLYSISNCLPRLKSLRVHLVGIPSTVEPLDPILSRLSSSAELEVLYLDRRRLPQDPPENEATTTLSGHAFVEFARSCKQIRRLCLELLPGFIAEDFTTLHLQKAVSALHDLREISLFFLPEARALATAAVSVFGRYCPNLEVCKILGEFTVLDIDWDADTVFPNLRKLSLNGVAGKGSDWSLTAYEDEIRRKFPRLETLQVMDFSPQVGFIDTRFEIPIPRSNPFDEFTFRPSRPPTPRMTPRSRSATPPRRSRSPSPTSLGLQHSI